MTRHWVIVGLMGSGKTTVGRLLAARARREFVDNDAQLQTMTGRTARDIEASDGVERLHELERLAFASALEIEPPAVIAAAASVIEDAATRSLMSSVAAVVWLSVPVGELARRTQAQTHRPLGENREEQLAAQAARRSELFESVADVTVDADRPPGAIVDELLPMLAPGGAL